MNVLGRCFAISLLALVTTACDKAPEKTDSMIRRDTADAQSQALIDKAMQLTSQSTFKNPSAHLDDLVIIQNLLRESRQLYRQAKITDWDNPELTALESQLQSLNKPLALESLNAVSTAIDKSIAFKQKKADVESLPVYDNSVAKRALYTHLEKLNSDLESCCLDKILLINRFLRTEQNKYYDVIKLGHNTLYNMGLLIRGEISEDELRSKIARQRGIIEKYDSLTASSEGEADEVNASLNGNP